MERPEAPDLVGRTSARLLALGVARDERLDALHLLAVLDASTDVAGTVRRPLDDLAAEFDLPFVDVVRSLDHLGAAGAVERTPSGVRLVDWDADEIGGLHLADFLDDVRTLDDRRDRRDRSVRVQSRGVAALAAAAAAVFVLAMGVPPSSTPTPVAVGGPSTTTTLRASASTSVDRPSITIARSPETTVAPPSTSAAPATTVSPTPDTTVVAASCPSDEPIIRLSGSRVMISNASAHDMVVTGLVAHGTALPLNDLLVPAGETVAVDETVAPVEDVTVDEWGWVDPDLERDCGE